MRSPLVLALVAICGLGAAGPATAADTREVRAVGLTAALGDERLSDEALISRVAGALTRGTVRTRPAKGAAGVGRLRLLTEDGPFEVYPVLESRVVAGTTWLHVRVPGRPNGRTGWVPRETLGRFRVVRTQLVVDRRTLRATLRRDGEVVWTSRVGVGAQATPTPEGPSWVRSRLVGLASSPSYGPYAFGTGTYSVLTDWPGGGVVGIHGTDRPDLIPGRPSHGCVRVPNEAIARLWKLMPVGTPVLIR